MVSVRHRRRLTTIRVLAVLMPLIAAVCALAAIPMGGDWPLVAAGVGVVASIVLGVGAVRLDRRLRVDVAAVRADQAAEYSEMHARYSEEHRQFTGHMVGLLDVAAERLDAMRVRVNTLETERHEARPNRSASTPSAQLAQRAEGSEWNDLWPDLSDAPTVVDLVAWDDKQRKNRVVEVDEPEERTA